MKILIIAEKPTQAQHYAEALANFQRKDGYFENEKYFITWCFGHLISLDTDDFYREKGPWNKNYLPLIPKKYNYVIGKDSKGKTDPGKKKQLEIIKNLIQKSSEVINATDADREGELIFMYVYNYLQCNLPYRRLWISTLTKGDIIKGFENLLSSNDMYHLGKSAYARAIADWLVGVNGTQACTLQFGNGTLLTIGRVQTAILKIICERFLKNKSFEKTFTYKIRAAHNLDKISFFSETETFENKTIPETLIKQISLENHLCINVEEKTVDKEAPLLHSIDTLIIDANKTYKYTGQETLDTAQKLYEKKLISYPRTDSGYINDENFNRLKIYLPELSEEILNIIPEFINNPKCVNTQKITGSHDAIIPTGVKPDNLSGQESDIYNLIIKRSIEALSKAAKYKKTKYTFDNNSIIFNSYTSVLIEKGWKKYSDISEDVANNEQSFIINVKKGDIINITEIGIKEIESKPPPLYSEENLIEDLKNFGLLIKNENPELLENIKSNIDIKKLQIGTQGTRPGIIERLKYLNFIELKSNKFIPTDKGLKYYEIFKDLEISNVIVTALWEMKLKNVAEGNEDIKLFYQEITDFTEKIVKDIFSTNKQIDFSIQKNSFGECPSCKKGSIISGKTNYYCSNYKDGCNFKIWNVIANKKLSDKNIIDLLKNKKTGKIKGFKSNAGKKFDAALKLVNDKIEFDF